MPRWPVRRCSTAPSGTRGTTAKSATGTTLTERLPEAHGAVCDRASARPVVGYGGEPAVELEFTRGHGSTVVVVAVPALRRVLAEASEAAALARFILTENEN